MPRLIEVMAFLLLLNIVTGFYVNYGPYGNSELKSNTTYYNPPANPGSLGSISGSIGSITNSLEYIGNVLDWALFAFPHLFSSYGMPAEVTMFMFTSPLGLLILLLVLQAVFAKLGIPIYFFK